MTPDKLKQPWNMVPLLIFSLTVGLLLLAYLIFPGIYPRYHQALADRNLIPLAAFFGVLSVLLPVGTLYWATRPEKEDE